MATSRLSIVFNTSEGEKTYSWSKVDNSSSASNIKALISAMIANKSVFAHDLLSAKSAKIVTTAETSIDIE